MVKKMSKYVVICEADDCEAENTEWEDSNGNSRFQQINWYTAAGVAGTMPIDYYNNSVITDGHGTHVAGIIAGKTFGWAKNAKIYSMALSDLTATTSTGISATVAFDLMKLFHRNKPINPATGQKRPTIVNASWGVSKYLLSSGGNFNPYGGIGSIFLGYQIWGGNYRGTNWTGYVMHPNDYALKGVLRQTGINLGAGTDTGGELYQTNARSSALDTLVQDLVNEGVHFTHAAGNEGIKADAIGGPDYDNYVNVITGIVSNTPVLTPHYYNRGNSPSSAGAINVGATDNAAYTSTLENRAYYSEYGTFVDI
jgi:hypothetical protein